VTKNAVRIILYGGIILVLTLCLPLGGCQKKLVHVSRAGAVEGFVKDSVSLIPIAGADVLLDGAPAGPYQKTDSTGYYLVGTVLADFRLVKITIKAQGFKTQDENVILKANQTQRLDFFLVKEEES
jgi:hypothetical protein